MIDLGFRAKQAGRDNWPRYDLVGQAKLLADENQKEPIERAIRRQAFRFAIHCPQLTTLEPKNHLRVTTLIIAKIICALPQRYFKIVSGAACRSHVWHRLKFSERRDCLSALSGPSCEFAWRLVRGSYAESVGDLTR
jgi:hypothetical protein